MNKCLNCGEEHNRKGRKGKKYSDYCSHKCYLKKYRQRNKNKAKKRDQKYHQQNRDKINKKHKEYDKNHKLEAYKRRILRKYGLYFKDINFTLKKQKYRCGICGIVINNPKDIISNLNHVNIKYHIDHNHKTGKFRGLLCYNCNVGLGLFMDNSYILIKASKYLQKTKIEGEND